VVKAESAGRNAIDPERLEGVMERGWLEITSVLSRQISRALPTAEAAADLLAELKLLPLLTAGDAGLNN
jgi:hypothetical protein